MSANSAAGHAQVDDQRNDPRDDGGDSGPGDHEVLQCDEIEHERAQGERNRDDQRASVRGADDACLHQGVHTVGGAQLDEHDDEREH
ncbi:hypothetical protein ACRCUN_08505 [Mycobacterium sp. LTG2003]